MTATTIRSLASTKSLPALDIDAVADDACAALGTIIRDLHRARCNPTHPVFATIDALVTIFSHITSNDAQTPASQYKADSAPAPVAYTPDAQTPAAPVCEKQSAPADATLVGGPDAAEQNDIAHADELFTAELARRVRMTSKEARTWGASKDQLARLVGMGRITERKMGRGFAYALAVAAATMLPAAPDSAPAPVQADQTPADDDQIPAGFGAAGDVVIDKGETPARKPRTRKVKADAAPAADQPITAPTPEMTTEDAFSRLGREVSKLDTAKAKRAAALMAQLRALLLP